MTHEELQALLDTHDEGILRAGAHSEGREFCALEFESKVRGRAWSDAPVTLPDLRSINDGGWSSDEARTRALLPVMVALWDWSTWSDARRQAWAQRVAIQTVAQIIAELPGLPDDVRIQCRAVVDLVSAAEAAAAARAAAWAAEAWAAARAARAAWAAAAARAAAEAEAWAAAEAEAWAAAEAEAWAARAAWAAAEAAARAARAAWAADDVLNLACRVWIQAATDTDGVS